VSGTLVDYDLVVAPILHVVPAALATRLADYVTAGGHLVTTYFSGIVDENDHVWLGGYPGAFRDLLGIRIEEFRPLLDGESVGLDNGSTGTLWTDGIELTDPEVRVLASYKEGGPAITVRSVGSGSAAYVSTRLGVDGIAPVLDELLAIAGIGSELPHEARGKVELVIRADAESEYWFLINRTDTVVVLPDLGAEPLLGQSASLAPRGVRVLRLPRRATTFGVPVPYGRGR
jgi:beta-galactosidase